MSQTGGTEAAGFPPDQPQATAGSELTEEQRAFLLAQQAQQAATSPSPAAAAVAAAAQMQAADRGPELPAETAMDQLMAALRAQSDQIAALQAQVGVMQKRDSERDAVVGGPPVVRYAQAAVDKLTALAAQHPDVGRDHFAGPLAIAEQMTEAAKTLVKDGGSADPVRTAAGDLERFLTRGHWRTSGKFIDFSALAGDVETALEEAIKLAA